MSKRTRSQSPANTSRRRMSSPHAISRFSPHSRKELDLAIKELPYSGKHPVHGEIGEWDVSRITDMTQLFSQFFDFDHPLNNWDVSKVTKMGGMFLNCNKFNRPLDNWNVSNVTKMWGMFYNCHAFNQPLDNWNVGNVTDMTAMFYNCHAFNRPLDNWNVSNVTDMSLMFYDCHAFNEPLNNWNVSKVTNMSGMFHNCHVFRQELPWELHPHVDVTDMFKGSHGRLEGFVSDVDCEGKEDPISLESIPKERGFRLEAEAAENNPELKSGRCYDAESLIHLHSQVGPLTRKQFTSKDMRRIKAFRRTRKSRSGGQKRRRKSHSPSPSPTAQKRRTKSPSPSPSPSPMTHRFTPPSREQLVLAIEQLLEHSGKHPVHGEIGEWDVSQITDMAWLFSCKHGQDFNLPLNSWNVSNVTDMRGMFAECSSFNQPLDTWNVGNVTDMSRMFFGCSSFNQPLDNWDVSNVTDMTGMFARCSSFNQPLDNWDVSNVTDMTGMFARCSSFDKPLDWNVSNVTYMSLMFDGCSSFDKPLNSWNVGNVTDMSFMFSNCHVFNRPLDRWNVSNVTNMRGMFSKCSAFRQELPWELLPRVDVSYMFEGSHGRLVFVSDVDCEGQMDPISLETIPKESGFRLEAEAAENNPELQHGRCYDAESLIHVKGQFGPLTRKPFTTKDKRRIEAYRRTRKSRSDDPM